MKYLISLNLIFLVHFSFAQAPINDECDKAIALGTIPACPSTLFNNINATSSNIGSNNNTFCPDDGNVDADVWFTFKTSTGVFDYNINVKSAGNQKIIFPNVAVFRGDCGVDNLAKICTDTIFMSSSEISLSAVGLTPNETYFIRVSDNAGAGEFKVCVKEFSITTLTNATTTACSGAIFDSGGPNKNYDNNENFTYIICPDEPHQCIKFTLLNYNLEIGEKLTFYNGNGVTAPKLREINGADFDAGNNVGGVNFEVFADANCLTLAFESNATGVFQGFEGKWQCTTEACPVKEPIVFNTLPTNAEIEDAIVKPGTKATLKSVNCGSEKNNYGIFNSQDNTDFGFGKGIVLSSGSIDKINQPAKILASTPLQLPGDFDLDSLSILEGGSKSRDACVLEFEVYANTDEISFDYIFASEEYPQFVSDPNYFDIFALMIEGQDITGDSKIKPKKNLAVLPDGTPISIGQVNSTKNYEYYRNNFDGKNLVYNGFTSDKNGIKRSLTARTKVTPCQTYKLKMAIADRGDQAYDSGVFIGDLRGAAPDIALNSSLNLKDLVEKCSGNNEKIKFKLSRPLAQEISFIVSTSGTATNGVDYTTTLPNVITFPAGVTELNFPISITTDNITELDEFINISLSRDYGCGTKILATQKILIKDNLEVNIKSKDTLAICADFTNSKGVKLDIDGATVYSWNDNSVFSNPNGALTTFKPTKEGWYVVTGKSGVCAAQDSVYAKFLFPSLKIVALSKIDICEGEKITLKADNNFDNENLKWSPNFLKFDNPKGQTVTIKPNSNTKVFVEAAIGGCVVGDSIALTISRIDMPALSEDTTVCYKQKVQIASVTFAPNTAFTWTPSGPSDPKINSVYINPTKTQTYILKGQTDKCLAFDTIKVSVVGQLDILGKDTIRVCKGSSLPIEAEIEAGTKPEDWKFNWNSTIATFKNPFALTTDVFPTKNGWVYAQITTPKCDIRDSIYVLVDSLPDDLGLIVYKKKPFYCPGDTLLLYSNGSMPKNLYPDATYQWQNPVLGAITPLDKANLKFVTDITSDYIRVIQNGICVHRDTFKALVLLSLPKIAIKDVSICEGQTVTLDIKNANEYETYDWIPADKLSCADCPNPTTTHIGNFVVTASKVGYCPMTKTVVVTKSPDLPTIELQDVSICVGQTATLSIKNAQVYSTFEWKPADKLSCADCATPTASTTGTYSVTASKAGFCPASQTVNVVPYVFNLVINASISTFCKGDKVESQLTATGATDVTWSPTTGLTCSNCTTPKATKLGTFVVTENTCKTKTSITLAQDIDNIETTTSASLCNGEKTTIDLKNANQLLDISILPSALINNGTVTFSAAGTYQLKAKTLVANCPLSKTITVRAGASPNISILADPSILLSNNQSVTLTASGTNLDEGTLLWQDNTGSTKYVATPKDSLTLYSVTGLSKDGCSGAASITIYKVSIPSIFLGQGEGVNSLFKIPIMPPSTVATFKGVKIFDRWGNQVYASNNNDGWNGDKNNTGEPLAADVYVYYAIFELNDGSRKEVILSGDVTLVR